MKTLRNMFLAFFYYRVRDKGSLFWNLGFPLMFMLIFGLAFSPNTSTITDEQQGFTNVGVTFSASFDEPFKERLATLLESYKIKLFNTTTEEMLSEGVIKGSNGILYGLSLQGDPQNVRIIAYLDVGKQNSNSMYVATVNSIAQELKTKEANFKEVLNVEIRSIDFAQKPVTNVGYILAGVLSVSITFAGLSALIISLGYFRKENVIRRLLATPLKGSTFLLADVLNNLLSSLISLSILFLVAYLVFRIQFTVNLGYLILTYFSSMIFMMALGGFFLVLFRSPKVAMNVSNLFSNILIFFSGVYFPLEFLPDWLRTFAFLFPMTYIARSMRFSLGQDFIPISEFYISNLTFLAIGVLTIPLFGYFIFKREME